MRVVAAVLAIALVSATRVPGGTPVHGGDFTAGTFSLNVTDERQVILGLGFEIQSDSIGSGNNGLPNATTSVPWDLVPAERTRLAAELLQGFRFCRFAMGLYFRGLANNGKNIVERWPGQAAAIAAMARDAGVEGFAVEYWSPPTAWKTSHSFINGSLIGFDNATLTAFGEALAIDVRYLVANGIQPVWWGLQNEPPVGPTGCFSACTGYNATQYHLAFKAAATAVRTELPDVVIHASSWSGQYFSPGLVEDPFALALVDAWTFHRVGADSDDQIEHAAYFLEGAEGRPVLNNEFEYLDDRTSAAKTMNTAQSIMNWLAFEDSPAWFWLHALKPITNMEAAGYGLGFWTPPNVTTPLPPGAPAPGHWVANPDNANALLGFVRYLPWDSVRLGVMEDLVRSDVRVLAYRFDPTMARWLAVDGRQPRAARSSRSTLQDGSAARVAATQLGFVLTNRQNATAFTATVRLVGLSGIVPPVFTGHMYCPNCTDVALGSQTAAPGPDGVLQLTVILQPYEIQFWVQV